MDPDLKIVVTTVLAADENESAARIRAQLPNIQKLIAQGGGVINIPVNINTAAFGQQAKQVQATLTRSINPITVGMTASLDSASISKVRRALDSLNVNPFVSSELTAELDQMGIQVDKMTGKWETLNEKQAQILSLTIQGTDQLGRTVNVLQRYDEESGQIETRTMAVTANLEQQRQEQERLAETERRNNDARMAFLTKQQDMLSALNASYTTNTAKPIIDEGHLQALNQEVENISAEIANLSTQTGELDKQTQAALTSQINNLRTMIKEYQNAEYVATSLRTKDIGTVRTEQLAELTSLETKLADSGRLTDEFRTKINELRTAIGNMTTKNDLVAFMNEFDSLTASVQRFEERIRTVNSLFTQLKSVESMITKVQTETTLKGGTGGLEYRWMMDERLSVLERERDALLAQIQPYQDIVQYSSRAAQQENARLINASKIREANIQLSQQARQYDQEMERVNVTIADMVSRFSQISNPTQHLIENMNQLRQTAAQYNEAMSNQKKVSVYTRLQELMKECRTEMSQLMRIERNDTNNFRLTENLEKARAELDIIRRNWSAFRYDKGLNEQFNQLSANLRNVNSQMDLRRWNAQFSNFKAQVKAAGRNVMSFGDAVKNAFTKVTQWMSATMLLFRGFAVIKSAMSTIVDLDYALIDLQKVTSATKDEYDEFYKSANDTAKALGATTEEVISQTAEWGRLGWSRYVPLYSDI